MKLFVVAVLGLLASASALGPRDAVPDNRSIPSIRLSYEGKVIGGSVVEPNSIPYQVALFTRRNGQGYFCGGSLISENYVLTAAHCVDGVQSVEVVLGAHNVRDTSEPNQVTIVASDFGVHPNYDSFNIQNDIGWVQLSSPAPISSAIQTVTLPSRSNVGDAYDGETATISGWGKTADSDSGITDLLRSVQASIMEWQQCNNYYPGFITSSIVCVDTSDGQGSCNGDSGGPLTINGVQVGLVSFGSSAGCVSAPSAFTRVTSYLDFIQENTDVVTS